MPSRLPSMFRSMVRALVRRRRFEDGLAEEVQFHMEEYARDLERSGVSPAEAERRARLEFGSVDNVKTDCREARGLRVFDDLGQDLRYAVRRLRKTPGFTATALATLALCLGANLAIFAVVDSVLLRPLPFPHADRLVRVFNTYPKAGVADDGCSVTNYYERRGTIAAFSLLAAYRQRTATVGEPGATEREEITQVTPEFFGVLGIGPAMGRGFTEEETSHQMEHVAVVTDAYWRQRLGADPQVIGRRIRVDGFEKTIVGVLPQEFRFLSSSARLYLPYASNPEDREPRRRHWGSSSQMIARLADGRSLADAQSQVDAHNNAKEADGPEAKAMADAGFRSRVVFLHADHVAGIRPTLVLVEAGVCCLLLIGAVNLVNLLLIQASGRAKELAVRRAIGARARHVVSGVLVETTLLTLVGGLLGLAIGAGGIRLLLVLGADRLPLGAEIAFDVRTALSGLAAALALGLAIGMPIAWYHLRADSARALHSESRSGTASRAAQRLRHGFLVAQMALSFVLLAGAGSLGLSLEKVLAVPPGFRPDGVLAGHLSLPWKSYPSGPARLAFTQRLLEELSRRPGVFASGVITNVPMSGNNLMSAAQVKGHVRQPGEAPRGIYSYGVGGAALEALGLTLRQGRFLDASDSRSSERVCVVDADFARRYWPAGGALGQRLFHGGQEGSDAEAFTVVGVVGPVKQAGLTDEDAPGAVYYPYGYWPGDNGLFVVARTSLPPESLGRTLRDLVRGLDPELPITDLRSMEARIADSVAIRRSPVLLASLFGGLAILLTAIGIYGVLSYAVAQRRREIGLRMALGARPGQVRAQFVSLAFRLLGSGLGLGAVGALLSGRALQAVLFQVPALHAATLASVAVVLGIVSFLACLLPSHRAARISPIEALAED